MAFPEEQPKETRQDGAVQQDGVQRKVITDCNQNENSGGIHIPKETEASPRIVDPVSVGNDICVSCQHDSQCTKEDDINDVPDADAGGPAESKSETKSKGGREEEMPVPQNHEAGYCTKYRSIRENQNIPERKRQQKNQLSQSHKGSSLFQKQMMGLIFIIVCDKSLVDANMVGLCGIRLIILDCKVPPNSHTDWIANKTTLVRNGELKTSNSNFALIGNENLKINITSNTYLREYRCEIWPPSDYVRRFPLKEFNDHCCQELLLKDNSYAVVEMRYGSDLINFSINYYDSTAGILLISSAQKAGQHVAGSPHCSISFEKNRDTNASTAQVSQKNMTNIQEGDDEISKKFVGTALGSLFVAGVVAGVICLGTWCCIKRWRRRKVAQIRDKEAAEPAIDRSGTENQAQTC